MAFRLYDQLPQYRDALGALCAGGTLTFTISGGTTPKNVYSTPAIDVSLGNVITLDADARHSEDVWLAEDVAYRVVLKDSDGATVWSRDYVRSLDTSVSSGLPDASDLSEGQVLASDGTPGGWYGEDLPLIPSQTGNAGKYLTTDGEALSFATLATYDADNLPGGMIGNPDKLVIGTRMELNGNDTAATNGTIRVTKAITFATAFTATPRCYCVATIAGVTGDTPSASVSAQATTQTTTGFVAEFFAGAEANSPATAISTPVTFNWYAVGEYDP